MALSTPLKDKDKSPNNTSSLLPSTDFTPKPSQLSSSTETPFTASRTRRTAATKADKYIDIVSRRLAEVPANGSTPKSMKIASKLISEATPNSRRNILLSASLNSRSGTVDPAVSTTQQTQPVATPVSVRKRNRTAKIKEMFQTSLLSQAAEITESGSLSPAAIDFAPSTISKTSKLSQVHTTTATVKAPSPKKSPVKSPLRRSQRVSPARTVEKSKAQQVQQKPSPLKEQSTTTAEPQIAHQAAVAATPVSFKAPVVEFVAPQSVLRSSKRPRKPSIYNEDAASPALKKQAQPKFADPSIFPAVNVNSQSHVKIAPPQTPQTQTNSMPQPSLPASVSVVIAPPNSTRTSSVAVPAIIVPLSATRGEEEASSAEDLSALALASSRRTPLRVQPVRTPTRAKAVIPSLSDYSTATKIAVIEVSKNNSNASTSISNVNANNTPAAVAVNSTPKVEPWTSQFMQKDANVKSLNTSTNPVAPPMKSALNINIKPVDTSKISGFSALTGSAAVPTVPKFPLNLANISNITKSSSTLLAESIVKSKEAAVQGPAPVAVPVIPPESPLSRAKRIDSENSSRDEKMKSVNISSNESKTEKLKKAIGELSSEAINSASHVKISTTAPVVTASAPANTVQVTSKLPVKPKSSTTVLPSPKIPSRLAEAFSGIDSELPPVEISGLVDDEKVMKSVLAGGTVESSGLANPKMKKQPSVMSNISTSSTNVPSTPITTATQLHRTAVLNSAARKINPVQSTQQPPVTQATVKPALPSTPKPQVAASVPSKTLLDTSSPNLPDIPSE